MGGGGVSGVTYRKGALLSFVMKCDGGGWVGQKRTKLPWRNYWTAPFCPHFMLNRVKIINESIFVKPARLKK